jgi:hypothetical protein
MRDQVLDLNQPMRRARRLPIVAACFISACAALHLAAWPTAAAEADQVRIGIARTMSDVGYYVADAMVFFGTKASR